MIGRFLSGKFGGGRSASESEQSTSDPIVEEIDQISSSARTLRSAVLRSGSVLPPLIISQLSTLSDLTGQTVSEIRRRGCSTEQRVLLNAMITGYVPTPLQAYLALPPDAHEPHSTATFIFSEQLATLGQTLIDLQNQIRIGAVEELSTHGRFLADKFAAQDSGLQLQQPSSQRDPLHLEGQTWHH